MDGRAADPDILEDMAGEGRVVGMRSYSNTCTVEIAGAGESPTHNMVIELSNDNGQFNRAAYYRKARNNDSGVFQGQGDFFAGLIFDNLDPSVENQEMSLRCRVRDRRELSSNPCVNSPFLGAGAVSFTTLFRNSTQNAYAFNANKIEELTAAASLCCRSEMCTGRTLVAIDSYQRSQNSSGGGLFGCWWNCDDSDEGTN